MPQTGLMPHAHQSLVRLGARLPFEEAASELHALLGIQVSDSLVRRQTLQAGARVLVMQTEQASAACALVGEGTEPVACRLAMSGDGAMVPLRGGCWAEVKTVVIAEVLPAHTRHQDATDKRTINHSCFSRLADATTFADLASVEITRRGIERAAAVCAVQDGAEWLQGFVDGHRFDAVRILDFAHAAEYLGRIAEQGELAGQHVPKGWLRAMLHELKHHGPERIMKHMAWWQEHRPLPAVSDAVRYFGKRLPQMQYQEFQTQGWPIGSGMVESANKRVMQARLKRAGMHWEPANVNPLLALRDALCNHRWEEVWDQQHQRQREEHHARRVQRSQRRRAQLEQVLEEQLIEILLLSARGKAKAQQTPHKGRTEGQKRWGRMTFSRKALPNRFAKM
ncbi:ISKra4 family transposase [Ktedonospora formicarum]|uniref:ISKra4 family transposase n=1 Tax=Ktedonospora formicarum TaxID=2778364 RepID=UPI001C687C11|nr:ISKra4 family transposase [Ktedonospora formicarum]